MQKIIAKMIIILEYMRNILDIEYKMYDKAKYKYQAKQN